MGSPLSLYSVYMDVCVSIVFRRRIFLCRPLWCVCMSKFFYLLYVFLVMFLVCGLVSVKLFDNVNFIRFALEPSLHNDSFVIVSLGWKTVFFGAGDFCVTTKWRFLLGILAFCRDWMYD
jgi:hypothetical protein